MPLPSGQRSTPNLLASSQAAASNPRLEKTPAGDAIRIIGEVIRDEAVTIGGQQSPGLIGVLGESRNKGLLDLALRGLRGAVEMVGQDRTAGMAM